MGRLGELQSHNESFQPPALPGGSDDVELFSGEYHRGTSLPGDPPAKPGAEIATWRFLQNPQPAISQFVALL